VPTLCAVDRADIRVAPPSALPPPPPSPRLENAPLRDFCIFCYQLPPGCDQFFTPDAVDQWLVVNTLHNNAVLSVHVVDASDARTAIRHLKSLYLNEHQVFVAMPLHLRKDRAFTP
jgi:hypothetical protein